MKMRDRSTPPQTSILYSVGRATLLQPSGGARNCTPPSARTRSSDNCMRRESFLSLSLLTLATARCGTASSSFALCPVHVGANVDFLPSVRIFLSFLPCGPAVPCLSLRGEADAGHRSAVSGHRSPVKQVIGRQCHSGVSVIRVNTGMVNFRKFLLPNKPVMFLKIFREI